jgi:serpin B
MHHEQRMPYAEADGWRMVTLPTESEVVVDVLLPAEGLTDLAASTLARLYDSAASTKIGLALPKFRIQASATLNEPLRALGIVTAFTRDADFSGITPARIRIDKIVHEAVLRVDEQGFEGAAATAVVMRLASFDAGRPVSFHVDRPFLLLVRHAPTGSLYFSARVTEP